MRDVQQAKPNFCCCRYLPGGGGGMALSAKELHSGKGRHVMYTVTITTSNESVKCGTDCSVFLTIHGENGHTAVHSLRPLALVSSKQFSSGAVDKFGIQDVDVQPPHISFTCHAVNRALTCSTSLPPPPLHRWASCSASPSPCLKTAMPSNGNPAKCVPPSPPTLPCAGSRVFSAQRLTFRRAGPRISPTCDGSPGNHSRSRTIRNRQASAVSGCPSFPRPDSAVYRVAGGWAQCVVRAY